jgi:Glycosyltransferase family 92
MPVTETAESRQLYLEYAAFARSKPSFDFEERELPLSAAAAVRRALELARRGEPWLRTMKVALSNGRRAGLVYDQQITWLESWAGNDDGALRVALAAFSEQGVGLEVWSDAAAHALERERVAANPAAALALGSLFAFAVDPYSRPVTQSHHFQPLENTLGYYRPSPGSIADAYAHHVDFATRVRGELSGAGIAVRDMLDVQGLIRAGSLHADFWSPGRRVPIEEDWDSGRPYLSICATYRDEAPYLREWIEFHRLVGVERFFLYNKLSADEHQAVLAPYVDSGVVVPYDWPTDGGQLDAYSHCVENRRRDSRWIAFIDVDEFLFPPRSGSLRDVLADYEAFPAVGVSLVMFGPSGHETKPPGLVTESYVQRMLEQTTIKSIVNPRHVTECSSVHHFRYDVSSTVDENKYPIHGTRTRTPSCERLRINHYFTKSVEEYRRRTELPSAVGGKKQFIPWMADLDTVPAGETDDAILRFVPALREALATGEDAQPLAGPR